MCHVYHLTMSLRFKANLWLTWNVVEQQYAHMVPSEIHGRRYEGICIGWKVLNPSLRADQTRCSGFVWLSKTRSTMHHLILRRYVKSRARLKRPIGCAWLNAVLLSTSRCSINCCSTLDARPSQSEALSLLVIVAMAIALSLRTARALDLVVLLPAGAIACRMNWMLLPCRTQTSGLIDCLPDCCQQGALIASTMGKANAPALHA